MRSHLALPAFSDRSPLVAVMAAVLAGIMVLGIGPSAGLAGLLGQSVARVATAVHAGTPGAAQTAATEVEALQAARASGRRVELLPERTETSQTFVNPSGTLTLEESVVPVRAHLADGSWAPVNTTLRKLPDGTVAPVAAVAPVAFSGGGAGPMATMTSGSATLRYWWPASLPVPRLSGATATYAEVLPGVDLQLRASAAGFAQLLVVKSPAAAANPALGELRFPIRTTGASLSADSSGAISAVDGSGRPVFQAPASTMWDSGSQRAAVQVAIGGGELDLRPDAGILANPATEFPVYIDPDWVPWTGHQQHWTKASANFPNQTYWDGANDPDSDHFGAVKMGRAPADSGDDTLWRSYFQLDTTRINGSKQINSATFTAWETWSVSCNPKNVELDSTGPISSSTNWNNRPNVTGTLFNGSKPAYGYAVSGSTCAGAHTLIFDVKDLVQRASDGSWGNITLGLRAPDEGTCYANSQQDTCEWRRFDSGELVSQHAPILSIEYDTAPNTPSGVYVDGSRYLYPSGHVPCDDQAHFVDTTQPVIHGYVSDPDEAFVSQPLTLTGLAALPNQNFAQATPISASPPVNADGPQHMTLPSGLVGNGQTIHVWPDAYDGIEDHGIVSDVGSCVLTVDTTAQTTLPAVTSADGKYPTGTPVTTAGTPGQFAFAPNGDGDVAGYLYGMNTPPARFLAASSTDLTATVTATPAYFGTNDLQVQIIGKGGKLGPVQDYVFNALRPNGPTVMAQWNLDETGGSTAHDSVGDHNLTVNSGVGSWSWSTSGHTNGALQMDNGAYAAGPEPAIDTRYGFTVSAWVNLDDTSSGHTLVSESGQHNPAFYLKENAGVWTFAMGLADSNTAQLTSVSSDVPAVAGTWTHLIGVYCDSSACGASGASPGLMYLYVGTGSGATLQSTQAAFTTPWQATGDVELGRNIYQDGHYNSMNGRVDDVSLYWADPCPAPSVSTVCSIP